MFLSRSNASSNQRQQGSMLVIALFVIVVMSLLGAAILRLTANSADSIVTEVYGQRALGAARAAMQGMLLQEFPHAGASGACSSGASSNFTLNSINSIQGLENCTAIAECSSTPNPISFSGNLREIKRFTSTGTCSAGEFIVSRSISVEALN